jgi:hypothetical protein
MSQQFDTCFAMSLIVCPSRIMSAAIILQPLIPNIAADTRSSFQFICPSVHLSGTAFFLPHINRSIQRNMDGPFGPKPFISSILALRPAPKVKVV